jgi:tetratricopeptide (TPR) repeat protein
MDVLFLSMQYYPNTNQGGNQEDKSAVKKAEQYLERLLLLEPRNSMAMVYLGSVLTMRARNAFFPWDKMDFMKKGMIRMDKAVALAPDNNEVRLIRGINSTQLPGMFNRLSTALEDFKIIENGILADVPFGSEAFCLPYYYCYGCALQKANKTDAARACYESVLKISSGSEYGKNVRLKLDEMEGR